ncbi:hypothetical protein [Pararhizobium sp. DWP3-4]|uniref:hypothetical protein n=1 Tax=Pararhizobium sp. DWP3-4 TaxID=2804565 RepID=UPI003CE8F321
MLEFLIDSKRLLSVDEKQRNRDVFISAYNDNERVKSTFDEVNASRKFWWILPDYGYSTDEYPAEPGLEIVDLLPENEAELVVEGLRRSGLADPDVKSVCVDITGFLHPHILLLLKYFKANPVEELEFIYTEPGHYSRKVETRFSLTETVTVRQVAGFEGLHNPEMDHDVVVIGIGYDHSLIGQVIANKESARVVQLHCFPSLSADMYQESILRLDRVSAVSTQNAVDLNFFATANDPYVTAAVLDEAVTLLNSKQRISNLYLSPLSTKPQALGFGLYYLSRLEGRAASMIYPFTERYSRETSTGMGRGWVYPIVFN